MAESASASPYVWDERVGRYRDTATGRYIAESVVKEGVENVAAHAASNMRALAQKYRVTPDYSLADFQKAMMLEIKTAHVATALAAYGGPQQMNPTLWGRVGHMIREQYAHLQGFVSAVVNGTQALNGRFDARAQAYGSAVRATYENLRRAEQTVLGYRFERNVLHANESCAECKGATARGWVPIGSLPPIGSRQCRSNCRCTLAYQERPDVAPLVEVPLRAAS